MLVTTAHAGRTNIMAMSWHMMIDFEPPIVGCVVSDRSHTFGILRKTKECVINIPTVDMVKKVVGIGSTSGRSVDKFKRFALTPGAASYVKAPLIEECYANLECTLIDTRGAARYNLFILKVHKAWVRPLGKIVRTIHHCGRGRFRVDGSMITVPSTIK
ncbi:MAG: flavin reductase family protein [Candidatus Omnitrophota bacterium]